jgi:hypothetical protein
MVVFTKAPSTQLGWKPTTKMVCRAGKSSRDLLIRLVKVGINLSKIVGLAVVSLAI